MSLLPVICRRHMRAYFLELCLTHPSLRAIQPYLQDGVGYRETYNALRKVLKLDQEIGKIGSAFFIFREAKQLMLCKYWWNLIGWVKGVMHAWEGRWW